MSSDDLINKTIKWYSENRHTYEDLATKLKSILEEIIRIENINYVKIESRAKSIESFQEKLKRIDYDGKKMPDLAGIRIIVFVTSDIKKIIKIIKDNFKIIRNKEEDKSKELGKDRIGYRSVHIIATISDERAVLPEYQVFRDIAFEFQIRTILEHAWAEIEHDRNYKYRGLPVEIQRRLYLISGTLEILDDQFEQITKTIEDYKLNVIEKTKSKELDIPINSTSLIPYIKERFKDLHLEPIFAYNNIELALKMLDIMEIKTLNQLEKIIPNEFNEKINAINWEIPLNYTSLIYQILLIHFKGHMLEKMKLNGRHTESLYGRSLKKLYDSFNIDTNEFAKFHMNFDENIA